MTTWRDFDNGFVLGAEEVVWHPVRKIKMNIERRIFLMTGIYFGTSLANNIAFYQEN